MESPAPLRSRLPAAEGLIAAIGVIIVLYFGRAIFIPLALAILLSFVLNPAALLLRRLWFGRAASILTTIFIATCLVIGVGAVVGRQITGLASDLPRYENALKEKIRGLQGAGGLSQIIGRAGDTLHQLSSELEGPSNNQAPGSSPSRTPIPVEIRQPEWQILSQYQSIIESVFQPLSTAAIVLVFLTFIMLQREDLRDRLIRLAGTRSVHKSTAAMDEAGQRLSRYFLRQTLVNSTFGAAIGIGLALIGVPNAILFGVVAGITRFVPYIGAYIAAVIPLVLATAIEPGWASFFWTLGLYVAGESFVGQVVEPWVYGHATGLSPFGVIVCASFWTWLWGAAGLIMSVPLTACFVVLGRHVESLEFLYILLTDAPALTPQQGLYQRLLAGNTQEALSEAEHYLKSHGLIQYYSEVAVPALELAQEDWDRAVLSGERLTTLGETGAELIDDLNDYADGAPEENNKSGDETRGTSSIDAWCLPALAAGQLPPSWQTNGVLTLGARNAIDTQGALIIAQTLRKHGVPASTPPLPGTGRSLFRSGNVPDVPMICISCFGGHAAQAQIRWLTRRLQRMQPQAHIMVCAWNVPEFGEAEAGLAKGGEPVVFASGLCEAIKDLFEIAQKELLASSAKRKREGEVVEQRKAQAADTNELRVHPAV